MNNDSINRVEPKDVTPEIAGSLGGNNSVNDEHAVGNFAAHVYLTELRGKCVITGRNTGSVGKYDFVAIYKGEVPSNPNDYLTYFYMDNNYRLETSYDWGSGYSAAYVSYNYRSGKYIYLAKTSKSV